MMDVAKYQVTAIFLSSIFSDIQDRSLIYCIVTITTTISLGVGLWLIQDKKQEDKKWQEYLLFAAIYAQFLLLQWSSFIIKIRKRSGSRRRTKRLLHLCLGTCHNNKRLWQRTIVTYSCCATPVAWRPISKRPFGNKEWGRQKGSSGGQWWRAEQETKKELTEVCSTPLWWTMRSTSSSAMKMAA